MSNDKWQSKAGFTLVELLVVISIIAILLAMLMPALSRARGQVASVVCRSNLKQIVYGASLWSIDHDGWSLPQSWAEPKILSWSLDAPNPGSLEPYLAASIKKGGNLFACPAAKGVYVDPRLPLYGGGTDSTMERSQRVTYGINGWMAACSQGSPLTNRSVSPGDQPNDWYLTHWVEPGNPYRYDHGTTKLMSVRRPGDTLFFTDLVYPIAGPGFFSPLDGSGLSYDVTHAWHSKKGATKKSGRNTGIGYANIGWVDGHVSEQPKDFVDKPATMSVWPRWWYYLWNH